MKYSLLGFKQEILVTSYSELNASDIIVLRTMIDLLNRLPRTIEKDGKVYIQMTYDMLLKDLPFITKSSSTIKKIVQKFIDNGLIERYLIKQGGNFTYFRTTEAMDALEYTDNKNTCDTTSSKENEQSEVVTTEAELMDAINLGKEEIRILTKEYGPLEVMKARNYVLEKYRHGSRINNPMAYLKTVLINKYYYSSQYIMPW